MAGIPEHIIDQVRDASNIVEVVGRYVTLKKRGRNFVGLCPFHQEKTPSFTVSSEKQIFHCFGCGEGGNVFSFLMKHDNISFVEAVKKLAKDTGIDLPIAPEQQRTITERERLYKANDAANRFFIHHLEHAPNVVKTYLQKRNISPEMQKKFQMGYAPDAWDKLIKYLQKEKYHLPHFEILGLIGKSEKNGRLFDRFRGRLMFPIFDQNGRIVGFGGRLLKDEPNSPKYINSPESPIYQKSNVLYGLNFAADAIRKKEYAVFVEGYMDVIQLFQAGIENVVATSGTALTDAHVRLISRYARKVVLCYDADQAGISAAVRGGEILFLGGIETEVLILPAGEDPDSLVKTHGADVFLQELEKAENYIMFRIKILEKSYDLNSASQKSAAANEILQVLARLQDPIMVNFYLQKIAELWQIPISVLNQQIQKQHAEINRRTRFESIREGAKSEQKPAIVSGGALPGAFSGAWGAEKDIVLMLIHMHRKVHGYLQGFLEPNDFRNIEFKRLYEWLMRQDNDDPKYLIQHVLELSQSNEVRKLLLKEMLEMNGEFLRPLHHLQCCIKQIKIAYFKAQMNIINHELRTVAPDSEAFEELLKRAQETANELALWRNIEPENLDNEEISESPDMET
jgi:DNA primase